MDLVHVPMPPLPRRALAVPGGVLDGKQTPAASTSAPAASVTAAGAV